MGGNPTTCIWPEGPIRLRRIYRWWDNQKNTPHLLTWDASSPIRHKTRRDWSTKRFGTDSADPLWRTRGEERPRNTYQGSRDRLKKWRTQVSDWIISVTIGIFILAYLVFAAVSFVAFASERKVLFYLATAFGLIILAAHGAAIVMRGIEARHLPWTNTYETLILLGFLIVAIYFATYRRYRMIVVGGFAGLIVSAILALTSLLSPEIEPLIPSLKSNWLLFHVVSAFIGYSSFALAAASAGIHLGLKFFSRGGKAENRLEYLNWLTYRFIAFGFPFLTLGISAGAVWANASWGRYWNWDPKETWAFITWLIYGICLHMQCDKGCRGTWVPFVTLLGFATVMFTYFGVNFWLSSLHAYW